MKMNGEEEEEVKKRQINQLQSPMRTEGVENDGDDEETITNEGDRENCDYTGRGDI